MSAVLSQAHSAEPHFGNKHYLRAQPPRQQRFDSRALDTLQERCEVQCLRRSYATGKAKSARGEERG